MRNWHDPDPQQSERIAGIQVESEENVRDLKTLKASLDEEEALMAAEQTRLYDASGSVPAEGRVTMDALEQLKWLLEKREAAKTSPMAVAEDWYRVEPIHNCLIRDGKQREPDCPNDVRSREFAEWMTYQYRLAMVKGFQLSLHNELKMADLPAIIAEFERLREEVADATLLMGDAWQDVISLMAGNPSVETALRCQLANVAGEVLVRGERIDELEAERDRLRDVLADAAKVIADRGICELDCTLPLPQRIDNMIVGLRTDEHGHAELQAEQDRLYELLNAQTAAAPQPGGGDRNS